MLFPPAGSSKSTRFSTPFQTLGARGLNNLAAKLLIAILPANSPFFRLMLDEFTLEKLTGKKDLKGAIEEALSRIERIVMADIEASNARASFIEAMKLLLVSGNVLIHLPPSGGMKVFRLDHYVVKRDPSGNTLRIIVEENLSRMEVDGSLLTEVADKSTADGEDTVQLYTCIERQPDGTWKAWQELEGRRLAGEGTYPKDKCPWMPLRMTVQTGEDYGRSYVEEYLGALSTLESLTKAIVKGSAAAAKVIFLVKANSTTKVKTLAETESGDIREGNAEDVTVVQMDKHADFTVAANTIDRISSELAYVFLLNSAIQRKGERVTAEEVRFMAGELDTLNGGLYSTLSQDFQLPYLKNQMARLEKKGRLPTLPPGLVSPAIVTGIDAIGRGQDLTKLAGLLEDLKPLGEEVIAKYLNVDEYIKRAAAARGVETNGLVASKEEVAAKDQQTQMAGMVAKLGPNVINQLGGMAQSQMPAPPPATP